MGLQRIEVPGGLFHVMARGNDRAEIFRDEIDYVTFLQRLAAVVAVCGWNVHGYCLLPNHYHLLIETPQPNLGQGMLKLNGAYARRFNGRHRRVGHVFQGPYRSLPLLRDSHLLELCRYIALNPVRAGLCKEPDQWPWCSYAALVGRAEASTFLRLDLIHELFDGPNGFATFTQPGINLVAEDQRSS